jgi:hypothetical protein
MARSFMIFCFVCGGIDGQHGPGCPAAQVECPDPSTAAAGPAVCKCTIEVLVVAGCQCGAMDDERARARLKESA